ncbi:MAG: PIN domain-containing protein [Bacillota bacterium]
MKGEKVYLDTSSFLAIMDADDKFHEQASDIWKKLVDSGVQLLCSNYVVIETSALLQRRLGIEALRAFYANVWPGLTILWVDNDTHLAGVEAVLTARRRNLSLVDCISFIVARRTGIEKVFAFDPHFKEYGFEMLKVST